MKEKRGFDYFLADAFMIIICILLILTFVYSLHTEKENKQILNDCGKLINQSYSQDINYTFFYINDNENACCWRNSKYLDNNGNIQERKCFGSIIKDSKIGERK